MDATAIDTITMTFVQALQSGTGILTRLSLPLLLVFATFAWYTQLGPALAAGGAGTGDALAGTLLLVLKIGVFYWVMFNYVDMATAAFNTFLTWGLSTGGDFSQATFTSPSAIINRGFRSVVLLKDHIDRLSGGLGAMTHGFQLLLYWVDYVIAVLAFWFVALHLVMTIIEYHLAVLVGTVLIPWSLFQPLAFFGEFSIGWLTGGLVRVLVTGALVGIAIPLFDLVVVNTTGGGDPTVYSALVTALTAALFAVLSWVIPARAAAIAGRGVSIALHGGAIVAAAAGGLRGVIATQALIRGVSSLIRRR